MGDVNLTLNTPEDRVAGLHTTALDLIRETSARDVLEKIVSHAVQETGARFGAVAILDEQNRIVQFVTEGLTGSEKGRIGRNPRCVGLIKLAIQSQQAVRVNNISGHPAHAGFPPYHPRMSSFLGCSIRSEKLTLGVILLADKIDNDDFSAGDAKILEILSRYAAVAIQNSSLIQNLRESDLMLQRRNENLILLNEMASLLASSSDVDLILDKTLTHVMNFIDLEVAEVFLRREDKKTLYQVMHKGDQVKSLFTATQFKIGEGFVGEAAEKSKICLIDLPARHSACDLHESALNAGLTQISGFPLTSRSGLVGVLCTGMSRVKPLDDLEIHFLASLSSWVGMAIENVRLNLQGRRLAVLEERERIGMDLHDGIIQSIYGVGLTLEHARLLLSSQTDLASSKIDMAIHTLDNTIRDIRMYITDLRPQQLYDENLMQGLRRLVTEFRANTLLEINLQGPVDGLARLPSQKSIALFHICQEALANIAKHSRAKHIEVALWAAGDRALLEVSDDGSGFDPVKAKTRLGHGLFNMQTRARNVGGDVDISTAPGTGVTILAWVPYSN